MLNLGVKVEQIQKTTEAETEKQLAITAAERELESARIRKERAEILLGTAVSMQRLVKLRLMLQLMRRPQF